MMVPSPLAPIPFDRAKYGREMLVDVAWVHDIPTFILDRPHRLGFYEIVMVTRGTGAVRLDGDAAPVRPGAVIFTRPGQIRDWQVRSLDGICLLFPALFLDQFFQDPEFLARLPYFRPLPGIATVRLTSRRAAFLRGMLLDMRRELRRLHGDSPHLLRARLYETLVRLARWFGTSHRLDPLIGPHQTVERFRALVDREFSRQHQLAWYARTLGVSPGHLNVLCRRHLGTGAKGVIQERLALEARRLLWYSDDAAARIAGKLGFKNATYFSRFFRRVTGCPPGTFRRGGPA